MTARAPDTPCSGVCVVARAFMLFVVLFLVVWLSSQFLVGQSPIFTSDTKSASQLEIISKNLPTVLASVDQAVSMLTTIQLSVFIVVGFVLKETLTTARRPTWEQTIAGTVFLCCAFASITLGYAARMQAIGVVNGVVDQTYAEFAAVGSTVVHQAFLVVISAISAVYLVVVALFDTSVTSNPTEPVADNKLGTGTGDPTPSVVTAREAIQDALGPEKGSP